MADKPIDTQELEPPDDASKSPKGDKDVTPSIQWLLVEARHARYAAQLKKSDKEAYHDYIVGLVFTLDGQPLRMSPSGLPSEAPEGASQGSPHALTKKVIGQIVAAFEERFGEEK